MVTDGGRMLKTALEKIFVDQKKAMKVWAFIGWIFIGILFYAMLIRYGSGLFSLVGFG